MEISIANEASGEFIISPLRTSFLLFVHHFSSSFIISPLRSSFLLFVHHFSSSHIIFPRCSSFSFAFINFPLRSSAAGHVGRVLGDFSFCTSIKFDTAVSAYIFPLRSSFLLFVHHFSSFFVHHFSSSFIISPLRSSFLLFVHLFSSSHIIFPRCSSFSFAFINFPLRSSAAGHVGRVLGDFSFCTSIKFDTAVSAYISPLRSSFLLFIHHFSSFFVHHFSASFIISPLRTSFFLFVHHFSSSFIISPLRTSFRLFVHHFSSSFIISPLRSSFLLFLQHFSSSFIISPLR